MHKEKKHIREQLIRELFKNRVFWSYRQPDSDAVSDDVLIEKTLVHLDIEDINKLFLVFPKSIIKKVWENKIVIRSSRFHSMNRLLAYLYFNIKDPDNYLNKRMKEHHKQMQVS